MTSVPVRMSPLIQTGTAGSLKILFVLKHTFGVNRANTKHASCQDEMTTFSKMSTIFGSLSAV